MLKGKRKQLLKNLLGVEVKYAVFSKEHSCYAPQIIEMICG